MAKNWTEDDEEFIRQNYLTNTYADLAEHFGVSEKAMGSKIRRMGLSKQDALARQEPQEPTRTEKEPAEETPEETPSGPVPISQISSLDRTIEEDEESEEEREERLAAVREAAEKERARREEGRSDEEIDEALELLEDGLRKLHDGRFSKAIETFQKIVQDPPSEERITDRARQYIDVCFEKQRTEEFKPDSADDFYIQGVVLHNRGDFNGAIESFEEALSKAPGDDRVLYCKAASHARKGETEPALGALDEAIGINDSNRVFAKNDADFEPLRVHEDFRELVAGEEEEAETQ